MGDGLVRLVCDRCPGLEDWGVELDGRSVLHLHPPSSDHSEAFFAAGGAGLLGQALMVLEIPAALVYGAAGVGFHVRPDGSVQAVGFDS